MIELSQKEQLILDLYTVNAIKFGEFTLKSGVISPFYLDLRILVSYPHLLSLTADVFWEKLRVLYFDVLAGVPYTAIPIATAVGVGHMQNMIFVRKEVKEYGTKKRIEGEYHTGQKAVVIDDVITNGESKFETIKYIEEAGLTVEHLVILVDRGQGGVELLSQHGYQCHPIYTMDQIFEVLVKHKKISRAMVRKCLKFIQKTRREFLKKDQPAGQKTGSIKTRKNSL